MINKLWPAILSIFLFFAVGLISPQTGKSTTTLDTCLECHVVDDLHQISGHRGCTQCHTMSHRGVIDFHVTSDKCITCHPSGNPSTCGLATIHGGSCLGCHFECGDNTHMDICLGCHLQDVIHEYEGHDNCAQCHDSESGGGQVDVGKCSTCHPDDGPGKCNLANRHSTSCIGCHTDCADGSTTTTSLPPGHIGDCLECHYPDILHEKDDHTDDCTQCHDGLPQAGNVEPGDCVSCHPADNPGTCGIATIHGGSCLGCHTGCAETTTTTTAASPAHLNRCLGCHTVDRDIHPNPNHGYNNGNCTECHEGNNVEFSKCAACHFGCTLPISHGSSCLGCHDECAGATTTTTAVIFR